jgi:hypothetical protein
VRETLSKVQKSTDTKTKQINVVQGGLTEVVDLDHVAVHLNTVLAPDVDLLHSWIVEIAGYRALTQMGNQDGSLAFLVFVMVDTAPVAASTAALVENGALPQCCKLTTYWAHLNEFVRDDFEELVDDRFWYPEGLELGMHKSCTSVRGKVALLAQPSLALSLTPLPPARASNATSAAQAICHQLLERYHSRSGGRAAGNQSSTECSQGHSPRGCPCRRCPSPAF